MKFGIIDAVNKTAALEDLPDMEGAIRRAGLTLGHVDFGMLTEHVHVVVDEFGLYVPVGEQNYFSVGLHLCAGSAVIFAVDRRGATVDLQMLPPIMWYKNATVVEQAIERNEIARPVIAFNDEVLWQWPPPPKIGLPDR
jgi:hypothetical protein